MLDLIQSERLDQMIIEASRTRPLAVSVLPVPCHGDQPHVLEFGLLTQTPCDLVSVHLRQANVEQDQLGLENDGGFQCRLAGVRHPYIVTGSPQKHGGTVRRIHVVIDDQYP